MFSRTVMPASSRAFGKARTRPWAAIGWLGQPVTSVPSKRTRPAAAFSAPEMMLMRVVLPAPFGPIRALIPPRSMLKVLPSTAFRPPKEWARSSISRIAPDRASLLNVGDLGQLPARCEGDAADAEPALREHALGPEPEDGDQQRADDHVADGR